jgi:hypothetical protein
MLPGEKVRLDTSIVIILQGEVITENDDKIIPAPELVFSNELRTKGKALVFAIPEIVEKVESGELKGES